MIHLTLITLTPPPRLETYLVRNTVKGQHAHAECTLQSTLQHVHPVIFESIDANTICSVTLRTTRSAGPSGLNAREWRRLCTEFKGASINLCNSIALVTRRLCTTYVDPKYILALLACNLIALDKHRGVYTQ